MFLDDFASFWQNYANFNGRTPRHGYWFVVLWDVIISTVLILLAYLPAAIVVGSHSYSYSSLSAANGFATFITIVMGIYGLATLVPHLALTVRRLHDIGKRGTWLWFLFSPCIIDFLLIIVSIIAVAAMFNSAITPSLSTYNYNSYSLGNSSSIINNALALGYLGVILYLFSGVYSLIVSITWIVWMASSTSPDAIGTSTHKDLLSNSNSNSNQAPQILPTVYGNQPLASPASYGAITITGVRGAYAHHSIPLLPNVEVVIGRDASFADVVLSNNAPKVSRKHCGITYNNTQQAFYVCDYSSNGTFREDGSRLVAGVLNPVARGSVILLGNADNSFRLG